MTAASPLLLGLLILTPALIAAGQLLFKLTSNRLVDNPTAPFYAIALEPMFLLALAIYGGATLLWIYVLKSAPLSYAYSFMGLTFVLVPLLSAIWLGETFTLKQMLGAGLIIAGLLVVQS